MPNLSIHIKSKASGLLKIPCILVSYYSANERPTVLKLLRHRKVEEQFAAERYATQEEHDNESHPYRTGFLVYTDWDKLINDELKYVSDSEWINQLNKLKLKFPQFKSQYS